MSMGWGAARKLRAALGNLAADPGGGAGRRPRTASICARRSSPGPARRPRWTPCARAWPARVPTAGWRPTSPPPSSWWCRGSWCARWSRRIGELRVREVRAPRGSELSCRGWPQEAAMRMLMNNLDPEVAENPAELVVYGGTGRAARSWEAFDAIVRTLRTLEGDETLLVQSGKPVGVFRTHEWAPRVLIANSNLVPDWATWDEFRRLEQLGLTMYGQMTAGLLDLHRHPGHRAGHLRVLRRDRAAPLRRLAGRHDHADRRPRRHGRRPAAGGDDERRRGPLRRGGPGAHPAPPGDRATSTSRPTRSRTRWSAAAPRSPSAARCRWGSRPTRPTRSPRCWRWASRPTSSPTRRAPTTRSRATCRT